jgi:hypothetical protein
LAVSAALRVEALALDVAFLVDFLAVPVAFRAVLAAGIATS